jgi:hypothetical protein
MLIDDVMCCVLNIEFYAQSRALCNASAREIPARERCGGEHFSNCNRKNVEKMKM